jgi:hypothetical protein
LDVAGGVVAAEKSGVVKAVTRQPACQPFGHARVARQRTVFGARKLYAPLQSGGQCRQDAQTDPSSVHSRFP